MAFLVRNDEEWTNLLFQLKRPRRSHKCAGGKCGPRLVTILLGVEERPAEFPFLVNATQVKYMPGRRPGTGPTVLSFVTIEDAARLVDLQQPLEVVDARLVSKPMVDGPPPQLEAVLNVDKLILRAGDLLYRVAPAVRPPEAEATEEGQAQEADCQATEAGEGPV